MSLRFGHFACRLRQAASSALFNASKNGVCNPKVLTQWRGLHFRNEDEPIKTVRDIVNDLTAKVGTTKSYMQAVDRSSLLELLPASQEELPVRSMKDSWDSAIIPLGSEERLREKYVTFLGGVRVGRLLEDLDVFAVWICYKHVLNPRQRPDLPSPYSIVTALVDRIDFNQDAILKPDKDIRLSGHVSWAGRSSIEVIITVEQENDGEWQQVTRAVFVMVARDPLNQGSAIINPLLPKTDEEKRIFQAGEVHKLHRQKIKEESLFRVPPNETEKTMIYDLFMSMANPNECSFAIKNKPGNSVWMEETKLKNLIICHPESRNVFNKIFGGFLMREAFEFSWVNASVFSKQRPRIIHIDDILFRRPVEIGSLLYLSSQVVYSRENHIQISTKASVMNPATDTINLTNIFHFTFQVQQPVPMTLPRTYDEALLLLDGRRHYQLVRGIRKFYGQGEMPSDTLV